MTQAQLEYIKYREIVKPGCFENISDNSDIDSEPMDWAYTTIDSNLYCETVPEYIIVNSDAERNTTVQPQPSTSQVSQPGNQSYTSQQVVCNVATLAHRKRFLQQRRKHLLNAIKSEQERIHKVKARAARRYYNLALRRFSVRVTKQD